MRLNSCLPLLMGFSLLVSAGAFAQPPEDEEEAAIGLWPEIELPEEQDSTVFEEADDPGV